LTVHFLLLKIEDRSFRKSWLTTAALSLMTVVVSLLPLTTVDFLLLKIEFLLFPGKAAFLGWLTNQNSLDFTDAAVYLSIHLSIVVSLPFSLRLTQGSLRYEDALHEGLFSDSEGKHWRQRQP
jgi:hypothetical protein